MDFEDDVAWRIEGRSGAGAQIAAMDEVRCVQEYRRAERQIRYLQAWQTRLLAQLRAVSSQERATAEVAAVLQVPRSAAKAKIDGAVAVVERLPYTLDQLQEGNIDLDRLSAIQKGTANCDRTIAAAVEDRILTRAADRTAPQVRRAVRDTVRLLDPGSRPARRVKEPAALSVAISNDIGGMADVVAHLPSVTAKAVFSKIDEVARRIGDDSDIGTRRAAAVVELVLDEVGRAGASSASDKASVSGEAELDNLFDRSVPVSAVQTEPDVVPVEHEDTVGPKPSRSDVARGGQDVAAKADGLPAGHTDRARRSRRWITVRGTVVRRFGKVTVIPDRVPRGSVPAAGRASVYHRSMV